MQAGQNQRNNVRRGVKHCAPHCLAPELTKPVVGTPCRAQVPPPSARGQPTVGVEDVHPHSISLPVTFAMYVAPEVARAALSFSARRSGRHTTRICCAVQRTREAREQREKGWGRNARLGRWLAHLHGSDDRWPQLLQSNVDTGTEVKNL